MTAKGIVDHSARIEQSLTELDSRARKLTKQVKVLSKQVISQSKRVKQELDKLKTPSKKFIPLFDQEKFYQWNEDCLEKFNKSFLRVSIGIHQYERLLHEYYITIIQIKEGL